MFAREFIYLRVIFHEVVFQKMVSEYIFVTNSSKTKWVAQALVLFLDIIMNLG